MAGLRGLRFGLLAVVIGWTCAAGAQDANDAARDEMNLGVVAYKAAQYGAAIEHFRKAVELAPKMTLAKTYLGTALAQNVVPGLQTPENLKIADESVGVFKQVLAAEPHNVDALKQIAAVEFGVQRLDEAREWQKKVLTEDGRNAEAAYTIGVIDWTQAHRNVLDALKTEGLTDDGEGNTKASGEMRRTVREKNTALVEEAIQYLQRAVENRPGYADAMTYMNLAYRRKADLDADDQAALDDDLEQARKWSQMAMQARKENEGQAAQTGASQN